MKLAPVTKLGKRNTATSKNDNGVMLTSFFQFIANLEQSAEALFWTHGLYCLHSN